MSPRDLRRVLYGDGSAHYLRIVEVLLAAGQILRPHSPVLPVLLASGVRLGRQSLSRSETGELPGAFQLDDPVAFACMAFQRGPVEYLDYAVPVTYADAPSSMTCSTDTTAVVGR